MHPYSNPHFYHHEGDPPLLFNMHTINAYLPCRRGTLDLLVMLGMLAGHAGDVENDADDVDGLV